MMGLSGAPCGLLFVCRLYSQTLGVLTPLALLPSLNAALTLSLDRPRTVKVPTEGQH